MKANYEVKCALFRDKEGNVTEGSKKFTRGNFFEGESIDLEVI